MNALVKIDHRFSIGLHSVTRKNDFTHTVAVIFARWVFWFMLFGLAIIVLWRRDPIHVIGLVKVLSLATFVGIVINLILGKFFVRKRPFSTHKLHPLISTHWLGGSFPSDHAMFSFAIATPLWIFDPVTGMWAMLIALLIAISRVAVGVHYFSDVIVGTIVGIASAYLVFGII